MVSTLFLSYHFRSDAHAQSAGFAISGERWLTYLGVDGEAWFPTVGWNYFADSVFTSLWRDLLDVLHRVMEFVLCRSEGGRILQAMWTDSLVCLADGHWVTSLLDGSHVERRCAASAEGYVGRICWVASIFGSLSCQVDLKRSAGRGWSGQCGSGRVPTRGRWDDHAAEEADSSFFMRRLSWS